MINDNNEVVFNTPQSLLDWNAEARKACPDFSLSDEFRKIYEAKARGENPMKTVYHLSDEEIEKYAMTKSVKGLQIESAEEEKRRWVRQEQRLFVRDEDEGDRARDARRQTKRQQRKASETSVGSASSKASGTSRSATMSPAEEIVAESSKTAAAQKPSATSQGSSTEQPTVGVIKSEIKMTYEAKPEPAWLKIILPRWLNRALKHSDKDRTQALRSLDGFKDCMRRCESAVATNKPQSVQEKLFEELRDHVHKAEIMLKGVDKYVVRKHNMLTVENGLPRIFMAQKADYPWDLRADAWQLYLRWYKQDFKPDLLRGIVTRKGKDRASDRIDPEWLKNPSLRVSANYHGQGDLAIGQWWPTQLCAVRDGAHGTPQSGIWGEKNQGAYSIVLSSGGYKDKDKDEGDEIWYSGTETKKNEPTSNTQRLIESCEEFPDRPVRVLRSSQLPQKNPYRPKVGLRYDGLYRVVGMERIKEGKEDYLFKLVRCEGQHPIRCEDNAARRPTKFEEAEYERLK